MKDSMSQAGKQVTVKVIAVLGLFAWVASIVIAIGVVMVMVMQLLGVQ